LLKCPVWPDTESLREYSLFSFAASIGQYLLQAFHHDRPDHEDRWSQIEDFKWIKPEPSPNWSLLDPSDAVPEEVWAEIVPGGPGWSLDDILHAIQLV
jgi:hypothetical protein